MKRAKARIFSLPCGNTMRKIPEKWRSEVTVGDEIGAAMIGKLNLGRCLLNHAKVIAIGVLQLDEVIVELILPRIARRP